jgi:hypothetical protein
MAASRASRQSRRSPERLAESKVCSPTRTKEADMKVLAIAAIGTAMLMAAPAANAKGCIKGALVGGTAGHFVGHHGFLGAAAGCVVGRHQANKHARQEQRMQQQQQPQTQTTGQGTYR